MNQSEYQAALMGGKAPTDDNEILSLSDEDIEEAKQIKDSAATGVEDDVEDTGDGAGVDDVQHAPNAAGDLFTKDQVQAIVRQRVTNLNKRIERLTQAESAVDKIAEVSGLSREQLIGRLNTMSDAEQAKILGIAPEQVAAMRTQRQANIENEKQIRKLNRDLELATLRTDKKYSDLDIFLEDILVKVEEHPSISLKDAYVLVKGELGLTAQIRDAEQRAVNSQAAAKSKAVVNPVGAAQNKPAKMSEKVVNNASKVGMDPNAYAAFQNIGDIDAYRAWKKAQKG